MGNRKPRSDAWWWEMVREQNKRTAERQKARYLQDHNKMIGQKFGRWEIIEYWGTDYYRHPYFLCICECGELRTVQKYYLQRGTSKSCGCLRAELYDGGCAIGNRYGHLVTIDRCRDGDDNKWICVCDCGALTLTSTWHLKTYCTQSCRCSRRDYALITYNPPIKTKPLDPLAFFFGTRAQNQKAARQAMKNKR
jgi:hypothetical protein